MTPFRYDGCNNQVEHSGLNVFDYSATAFTLDEYVYHPVRTLGVDDFLWDLKWNQQTSE